MSIKEYRLIRFHQILSVTHTVIISNENNSITVKKKLYVTKSRPIQMRTIFLLHDISILNPYHCLKNHLLEIESHPRTFCQLLIWYEFCPKLRHSLP